MGGAANNIQRGITALGTFGASELGNIPGTGKIGRNIGNAAKNSQALSAPTFAASAGIRSGAGARTIANAPKEAAKIAADSASEQSRLASEATARMAIQPKKTASDNFLSNKNKMLQNMRLGLMSSVGGSTGAVSPSLAAPSLGGKSKLGS